MRVAPFGLRHLRGCGGTQPLAGEPVAGLLLRDPDLNPCFSHERGGRCRVCAARHALCRFGRSAGLLTAVV